MNLVRTWTGQSDHAYQSTPKLEKVESGRPAELNGTPASAADFWAGHHNRLSESQQTALSKFKAALLQQKLFRADPQSHDDPTLIRYLRARKWDVHGAIVQFRDTETMRKENRIEELYDHIDIKFYERARLLYPQWTGRRDKRGLPLYVYQIKHLDTKTVHNYTKDTADWKKKSGWGKVPASSKLLPLYALYENLMAFVLPLCSTLDREVMDVPITQETNIVDVSGVGIKHFWNLKSHMQEASQMATAHFPETLDRIFIIGAPYFFPTVWGWIKRWFDPITVGKIFILSNAEVLPTLEKFFDRSSIPKDYGGDLDWTYGEQPNLDAKLQGKLPKEWIPGPCRWEGQVVQVGSFNGKDRPRIALTAKENIALAAKPLTNGASLNEQVPPVIETPKDVSKPKVDPATAVEIGMAAATLNAPDAAADEKEADAAVNGAGVGGELEKADITSTTASAEPSAEVNGIVKLPSNSVAALPVVLGEAKKGDGYTNTVANGVAKPSMERFHTAAETLPTATA